MTNGDKIRNMTDEELAEHILSTPAYETCIKFCKNREECCEIMDMDNDIPEEWCKQCLLYWQNNDMESECNGQEQPCHEFCEIEVQDGKID